MGFSLDSLEQLRNKLLDLTARNRLLNFKHGTSGSIRIVDELPDQICDLLLSEKELEFLSIPEPTREQLIEKGFLEVGKETTQEIRIKKDPTASEWAKQLKFETNYELPLPVDDGPEKHQDNAVQTLLFPYEMETQLRTLRNKAETAIEESGANILYLSFGFLEWYENKTSDQARMAPLYLVPVKLNRGKLNKKSGTYIYTLNYTGEDIFSNLSLREKLKLDFGLALPEVDDSIVPEAYFSNIEQLIKTNQPRWKLRRCCTLALLNFGKLLMYLDLDPERWPEDEGNILNHPIVKQFFISETEQKNRVSFSEEYDIDSITQIHDKYPLIDDADSSQHSAMIDAINGTNMVIEGPPGTGKSQTITNLIAAALAQNKKVLFVAEKLAALQVVKHRLDKAGLGDFCLELHSHKTQKNQLLQNINTRLINHENYKLPSDIDVEISRYETLKDELINYVNLINQPWKKVGKTIHQILMIVTRYRLQFGEIDTIELHPTEFDIELFTVEKHKQYLDTIDIYEQAYLEVVNQFSEGMELQSHPWAGVNNLDLQIFDSKQVCNLLSKWNLSLLELQNTIFTISDNLNVDKINIDLIEDVKTLSADLSTLESSSGNECFKILSNLQGDNLKCLEEYLKSFKSIQQLYQSLNHQVDEDLLNNLEQTEELVIAQNYFEQLNIDTQCSIVQIANYIDRITSLLEKLNKLNGTIKELSVHFGKPFSQHIILTEEGVTEFEEFVKQTSQLKVSLWKKRHDCFDDDEIDEVIPSLRDYLDKLLPLDKKLKEYFFLDKLPASGELRKLRSNLVNGGFFKYFKPSWRKANKQLKELLTKPNNKSNKIQGYLSQLIVYSELTKKFESEKRFKLLLGSYYCGIDTRIEEIELLRAWYKSVRQYYGIGFGPKVELGQEVIDMPDSVAKGLQSLAEQGLTIQLNEIIGEISFMQTILGEFEKNESLLNAESTLVNHKYSLEQYLKPYQKLFVNEAIQLNEINDLISILIELRQLSEKWKNDETNQRICNGILDLNVGLNQDNDLNLIKAEATLKLAKIIVEFKTDVLKEALYNRPSSELFIKLASCSIELKLKIDNTITPYQLFAERTQLNHQEWMYGYTESLSNLQIRNELALNNQEWLANWLDFARINFKIKQMGFSGLINAINTKQLEINDIKAAYQLAVFDLIARDIISSLPELAQFSGNKQNTIQQQFSQYDENLKSLQQQKIAWKAAQNKIPQGNRGGKVATYTELALLQHECGKKIRHLPIRQLIKRSGQALLELKPCFMMGPMSAAQYLPPGEIVFDLIIMDEASQLKPEDALGVIARGKQLIVVGDSKQLPPTSFFDKTINADEDDNTALEESESILDAALPLFTARRLRWHYRSQHESLIAFSNQSFYNGDLVVFPSPLSESENYGVKFIRVKRGKFIAGCNIEEAQVIAETVIQHLIHRSNESLGVVAMNAKQRELIERAIENLTKESSEVQEAIEFNRARDEPLFVKNLENVQGDERDVIYISCTYGPSEEGGHIMQRFGPINLAAGWRRLNVLFTRSKKRMHIFSSMGAKEIVVSEKSSRGVKAFKDFLTYAETGYIQQSVHPTSRIIESDFEIAVSKYLRDAGFETQPQVGVAGFYIDLAVLDPEKPGRYLMGIECDGPTYHSAKSTRDRDRLRQAVLEQLGWHMHRIWSIDWFKNPQAEMLPLIRKLNQLKTEVLSNIDQEPELEVIKGIMLKHNKEEQALSSCLIEQLDLKTRLEHFNQQIIQKQYPSTPGANRLLRPAMLEALLEFLPVTIWEFKEMIPPFLRESIDSKERHYLEQVLEIIREYDSSIINK